MKKLEIEAVLFDLDGVLIDSFTTQYLATKSLIEKIGIKLSEEKFRKNLWGEFVENSLKRYFKESWKEAEVEYENKIAEFLRYTKLFPETIKVLEELKKKNIKLGIVTSNIKTVAKKFLVYAKIEHFFDVLISGEDCEPKPAPDGILVAIKSLKVSAERTIFVGDNWQDVEAGKSAGCFTIAVGNHLERADAKISRIGELLRFV
jgi:pyrophosphatase PpaX